MKEELINFETAKLAKEKGFFIKGSMYDKNGEVVSDVNTFLKEETFSRCTQSILQRWLREEHNIHICIDIYDEKNTWGFDIYNILDIDVEQDFISSGYKSYEEALEEGLKKALNEIQ